MGMGILNIGISGLHAAQAGLQTASHNIANAATPGYNRQQVVQGSNTPLAISGGFLGQGTHVATVKRVYSDFLDRQVMSADSRAAELEVFAGELAQIDNLLADPEAGLSPAMQEFFKGVQELAANPSSLPARQALLSAGETLSARFHDLSGQIGGVRAGINTQILASVEGVNTYSAQIANLNERIHIAEAAGTHAANDLRDQRDQLLADLNKEIGINTSLQSDGSLNVYVGNGQALVVGTQAFNLSTATSSGDPEQVDLAVVTTSGTAVTLKPEMIAGGKLGGLLAFRADSLDTAQNALGRIAAAVGETVSAQHRLGQDLLGNLGGDFFQPVPAPRIYGSEGNGGAATLRAAITDVGALTTSDYRLSFDGASYSLLRLSDDTVTDLGAFAAPVTVDGFSLTRSGAAAAGDSFLIQPTRGAALEFGLAISDVRQLAVAMPVRSGAGPSNNGTAGINAGAVTSTTGLPLAASPAGDITLSFDAANNRFNITGGPGGTLAYNPATEAAGKEFTLPTAGGFTFSITGTPANGDTFVIARNTAGSGDNRNALALGQLQTRPTLDGGTASYQSAYAQLVSEVGNKARQTEVNLTAQQSLAQQATAAQQSISGVNLDEEAASLMRYQQAYQASARVMEVASRLFDELLGLGR